MKTVAITLTGVTPLLMHNEQLVDPLNEWTKKIKTIQTKKTKTDADHALLREYEFKGGLYYAKDLGPYIPGHMLWACLIDGGKFSKMGAALERGLIGLTAEVYFPLLYDGPRDMQALWEAEFYDVRPVKVPPRTGSKVMRVRPRFHPWRLEAELDFEESQIKNVGVIQTAIDNAGAFIGMADGRKQGFGRFEGEDRLMGATIKIKVAVGSLRVADDVTLDGGESTEDIAMAVMDAAIRAIYLDIDVTAGGVTMSLADWMDPYHWEEDWKKALDGGDFETYVAGLVGREPGLDAAVADLEGSLYLQQHPEVVETIMKHNPNLLIETDVPKEVS